MPLRSLRGPKQGPKPSAHQRDQPGLTLTVDAAGLVAVVDAIVDLVTLFGSVDAGAVATLELVWAAGQQGWKTHKSTTLPGHLEMGP